MRKVSAFVFVIGIIVMSAWSSSCQSASSVAATPTTTQSLPVATTAPTKISPTATIIPTSSPTPIPAPPVISASNVMNLQEDFRIGQGGVSDAVWLPDGNVALVLSTGISIYDPDTGKLVKSVEPENKAIGASIISQDGKRVAVLMHKNNKVLVWDSNTGKIEYELETRCKAQNFYGQEIAFNNDGSQLATCDEEGVSLWDLASGKKINALKIERKDYLSVAFNPKNNTLATISSAKGFTDGAIWDLASGEAIEKLPQSSAWIALNIRFNHRGDILAWQGFGDPKGPGISLYDINTNQRQIIYAGGFQVFEFSPDDKTLTIGSVYGKGTRLLDITTSEFITEPKNNAAPARLIKYSLDGSRFIAGWNDFSIFKNVGGAELKRLGTFLTYSQIAFDPEGRYIAAGEDVTLWDLQTRQRDFDHIFTSGNNFLFTLNGDGLITNAWKNDSWWAGIQQWDLSTKNQQNFEGTLAVSYAVNKPPLLSPAGDLLAIGIPQDQPIPTFVNKPDGSATYIRFWDANSKKFLFDIKQSYLSDYEFSPDGKIFASAGKKTINFWDLYTQKTLKQLDCPTEIYDIAFSPDGALIAAAAFDGVYIWVTNSGELVYEIKEVRAATQVAFSPQGNILAVIGYDKDLHKILFAQDLPNNKLLYKITGDEDNYAYINNYDIWNLADKAGLLFSPGGSFIVTSGLKRQGAYEYVQFWDTSSGQLIKTLEYTVNFSSLSPYQNPFGFSLDGRLFAIADWNGIAHVLHIADSSDNGKEDIMPTSIPIVPRPPLPTPTVAPTVAVESIFPNFRLVETDMFDNSNSPKWQLDPSAAKIKNGVLQFVGKNWGGGHYDTNLSEGYGIIINFKYTQDSEFEMLFENGGWNTSTYKRFGVYIVNDRAETNIWQGKTPLGQTLNGSLEFGPDTWYSLLLTIERNNEFYTRIWNPENPAQAVEYKHTFRADWSDLTWTFKIGANNGTILFDDFKVVEIK